MASRLTFLYLDGCGPQVNTVLLTARFDSPPDGTNYREGTVRMRLVQQVCLFTFFQSLSFCYIGDMYGSV